MTTSLLPNDGGSRSTGASRRRGQVGLLALTLLVLLPLFTWLVMADNARARSLVELEGITASASLPEAIVAPPPYALHSHWVAEPIPRVMSLGKSATFSLAFENTGSVPWVRGSAAEARLGIADNDGRFAAMGFAFDWPAPDRVAVQTERVVEPGGVGHFTFKVRGQVTGLYRIPLRLLVEDVAWMEDDGAYVEFLVRA